MSEKNTETSAVQLIDEWLSGASLPETVIPICLDSRLIGDREALVAQALEAERAEGSKPRLVSPAAGIARQIEELDAKIEAATRRLRLRAAHPDWLDKHVADAEVEGREAQYDYAYAMLSHCAVEPEMTPEQAKALRERIGQSQWGTITQAMMSLTYGEVPRTPFVRRTSETIETA